MNLKVGPGEEIMILVSETKGTWLLQSRLSGEVAEIAEDRGGQIVDIPASTLEWAVLLYIQKDRAIDDFTTYRLKALIQMPPGS